MNPGASIRLAAKFRALSPRERCLFLEAGARSTITSVRLWVDGRGTIAAALDTPVQGRCDEPSRAEAEELSRFVVLASRHAPGLDTCLSRALVLHQMMARRGIESALKIGVSTQAGFDAHAWVEHGGEPVNEARDVARFAAFAQRADPA